MLLIDHPVSGFTLSVYTPHYAKEVFLKSRSHTIPCLKTLSWFFMSLIKAYKDFYNSSSAWLYDIPLYEWTVIYLTSLIVIDV